VPVLDGPYTSSEGADALRHFGTANHYGKVIITMGLALTLREPQGHPEHSRGVSEHQRVER